MPYAGHADRPSVRVTSCGSISTSSPIALRRRAMPAPASWQARRTTRDEYDADQRPRGSRRTLRRRRAIARGRLRPAAVPATTAAKCGSGRADDPARAPRPRRAAAPTREGRAEPGYPSGRCRYRAQRSCTARQDRVRARGAAPCATASARSRRSDVWATGRRTRTRRGAATE